MMRTQRASARRMGVAAVMVAALALAVMTVAGTSQAYALGVGDTFTKGGNTYKVTEAYENSHDWGEVTLVKYGASSKTPTINTVKYQGHAFEVDKIGKNAFNNKKGHRITAVKLGKHVDRIGAKAFYGCKKLKTINLRACDAVEIEKENGRYQLDELNIGSKAFAKAGKSGVKVKCGSANASYQKVYKNALKKKGLRSDAKVVK